MTRARRVVFRKHGGVDVLEVEPFEPRAPRRGEVRVAVAFSGVNYADVLARRGFYKWAPPPPTCVGFELAGTVEAIGDDVRTLAVGDAVAAVVRFGGYASHVIVEENRAWKLPSSMPLDHGAALPAVYMTAWHSLVDIARMRAGETILIQAVAGGVGLAALQIAKRIGAITFGTASSEAKLDFARAHGLDHAIDYSTTDFEREVMRLTGGRGVDVVLDSLGGEGLKKGYRALARCGRIVTIGAAQVAPSGRTPIALARAALELVRGGVFHPFQLIEDNKSIAGVQILLLWDEVERLRRGIDEIFRGYEEGALRPHVDRVFTFDEAKEAHRVMESRASRGKLLLRP